MSMRWLPRSILLSAALLILVFAGGCNDDDISTLVGEAGVRVSGTIFNPFWTFGNHRMGVFPGGVLPGPSGSISGGDFPGGTTVPFQVTVPSNSGGAYIYAFEDVNGSGDPQPGPGAEPVACSTLFNVGTQPIDGVTINLNYNIPPDNCPGGGGA